MRLKLLAILALIGGPILAVTGFNEKKTLDKIKAEGVEVPGSLESGEGNKSRRGITTYKFDVAWITKDGKPYKKNMSLPGSFVKPRLSGKEITNPDVTIRYLPSNPTEAFVVGAEGDPDSQIWGGTAAGALGLVGTVFMLRKRQA